MPSGREFRSDMIIMEHPNCKTGSVGRLTRSGGLVALGPPPIMPCSPKGPTPRDDRHRQRLHPAAHRRAEPLSDPTVSLAYGGRFLRVSPSPPARGCDDP